MRSVPRSIPVFCATPIPLIPARTTATNTRVIGKTATFGDKNFLNPKLVNRDSDGDGVSNGLEIQQLSLPGDPSSKTPPTTTTTVPGTPPNGQALYAARCAACHGANGGNLNGTTRTRTTFINITLNGQGNMPAQTGLSSAEAGAIWDYVTGAAPATTTTTQPGATTTTTAACRRCHGVGAALLFLSWCQWWECCADQPQQFATAVYRQQRQGLNAALRVAGLHSSQQRGQLPAQPERSDDHGSGRNDYYHHPPQRRRGVRRELCFVPRCQWGEPAREQSVSIQDQLGRYQWPGFDEWLLGSAEHGGDKQRFAVHSIGRDEQRSDYHDCRPGTASGATIYGQQCALCHGANGGNLRGHSLSLSTISGVVTSGQGSMSGFSGRLSAADINSVAQYVLSVGVSSGVTTTTAAAGSALSGANLYMQNCSGCHGLHGEGGPGGAVAGTSLSRSQTISVITGGTGGMPGFASQLSAAEIAAIADHVLGTAGSGATGDPTASAGRSEDQLLIPPELTEGHALFGRFCAACHGANGEGGPGGAVAGVSLSAVELDEIIRNGVGSMPGFAGQMSDEELAALVAYTEALASGQDFSAAGTTTTTAPNSQASDAASGPQALGVAGANESASNSPVSVIVVSLVAGLVAAGAAVLWARMGRNLTR